MKKKALLAAVLFLRSIGVGAEPTDPLNSFLSETKAAKGSFEQQTFQKDGKPAESPQSGNFVFSRPGKFIWSYKSPYEQEMVCDGQKIYIWDKDLNQVTVRSAKQSIPQSPASILFGTTSYQKDWISTGPIEKDGLIWITLKPKKKDAAVSSVEFGFKSKEPKKLKFVGAMGETTFLDLKDLHTDAAVSDKDFIFRIPKGADVVEVQ